MGTLTVTSKEMTLRNLASDITSEIRHQIQDQKIMSIPHDNFLDENYMGNAGVETIKDIEDRVNAVTGNDSKSGLLSSVTLGLWKERRDVKQNSVRGVLDKISLRVGESPVLNPPWQFNELDDVRSNLSYPHMGRVYLTYIYQNFPILVFKPGREKMNANILTFFTKGFGTDSGVLNNYIREGGTSFLTNLKVGLISIKNTTLGAIESVFELMGVNFANASKYIIFKPAMRLYRSMANNLLKEYAANMGLLDLTGEPSSVNGLTDGFNVTKAKGDIYDSDDKNYKSLVDSFKETRDNETVDDVFGSSTDIEPDPGNSDYPESSWGRDGIALGKKIVNGVGNALASTYRGSFPRLDVLDMIPHVQYENTGMGSFFGDIENMSYLPYLCQSNISISETFSNSTKEHPIVSQINSMSQEAEESKNFGAVSQAINAAKGAIDGSKSLYEIANDAVTGFVQKFAGEAVGNISEMGGVMNGDGRLLIPEIWASSGYSRSYSVEFNFWSPTGDTVSIFENVYIPYLLLLVLTMPLQTGYNSYLSPFIVKVFSKGLFSVDMGLIESLSVTKGDGESDRSMYNFPRTIKVSVGVKDLSPVMMLSLGNGAFWKYRRANSSLTEYISTMTNLSISDRFDIGRNFNKYWSLMTANVRDKFSLTNVGFTLGNSFLLKPAVAWNRNKVNADVVQTKNIYY